MKNGITTAFGLQGGAVAHIFDSFERKGLSVVYTAHEAAASLAAAAYAKSKNGLGCCVVTTGPGTTNALTGLLGAWQDSIPCIFLSGQVRSNHMSYGRPVRQVGTQEVNIVDIVRPITKWATVLKSSKEIEKTLSLAINRALSGRPGPVWIDIPLEFQWDDTIEFNLKNYRPISQKNEKKDFENEFKIFEKWLQESACPLFILGYGIFLSGCVKRTRTFLRDNQFMFVSTWTGVGILGTDDALNLGIIGMSGQPGANKAVFKADLLVCLGTHLGIPHTTTLTENYAPKAKKVFVNIDGDQLNNLSVSSDLTMNCDLRDFFERLNERKFFQTKSYKELTGLKQMNVKKIESQNNVVDSNNFFRTLTAMTASDDAIIVDGGGTALYTGFQSAIIKENQRMICSSSISSMGTGFAEVIGAFMSKKFRKFYCIIGDGSALMNVQDLQTIRDLEIPVVICLINNNGYLAIRHTQESFLGKRFFGTHPDWNLGKINFKLVSNTFGLEYLKIRKESDILGCCKKLIYSTKPTICEVITSEKQKPLFSQGYQKNKDGTHTPLSLEFME